MTIFLDYIWKSCFSIGKFIPKNFNFIAAAENRKKYKTSNKKINISTSLNVSTIKKYNFLQFVIRLAFIN